MKYDHRMWHVIENVELVWSAKYGGKKYGKNSPE